MWYGVSLLQKPHKSDSLFIKVGSRLTDYTYNPSLSCNDLQKVTFTFPWRVSIFCGNPCLSSLSVSRLNWVDSLMKSSCVTLRFRVTVNDSINLRLIIECLLTCLLSPRLLYARNSQSYPYPMIGQARSASWHCSGTSSWWPVWNNDVIRCRPSNRMDTGIEAMLIAPCISAVYRCIWSHWQFHR